MRSYFWMAAVLVCVSLSGCALCPPGYLEDYPISGGKWQRGNPVHGRVGSILSDPGSMPAEGAEFYYQEYSDGYGAEGYQEIPDTDASGDAEDVFPNEMEGNSIVEPQENNAIFLDEF